MPPRNASAGKPLSHGTGTRQPAPPWSAPELSRLILAARSMPGDVGTLPARLFWPAFILASVDCGLYAATLFTLPVDAFDDQAGVLRSSLLVYELHPLTIDAFSALRPFERERLLPWPLDAGGNSLSMLYCHFRKLLYRADLPRTNANMPKRLVRTSATRERLDQVELARPFTPRLRRLRKRRGKPSAPALLLPLPANLLRGFLDQRYIPNKLTNDDSMTSLRSTVNRLGESLGRHPVFSDLTDPTAEQFATSLRASRSPATVNKHLRNLLALWRYAWKKRKVDELPRDVSFDREQKKIPEAWSLDELNRLLAAAEQTDESIGGVSSPLYWRALLLTAYYTGVRIDALTHVESSAFDPAANKLTIPAGNPSAVWGLVLAELVELAVLSASWMVRLRLSSGSGWTRSLS
ncbi:MAG: hypothetical protein ACK5Q5_15135, partial [Planctomycetaceae bacterium]